MEAITTYTDFQFYYDFYSIFFFIEKGYNPVCVCAQKSRKFYEKPSVEMEFIYSASLNV